MERNGDLVDPKITVSLKWGEGKDEIPAKISAVEIFAGMTCLTRILLLQKGRRLLLLRNHRYCTCPRR
ncbi:MAG: hypothetical protein MZU95_09955 [Desulfomicrobium escambiense]|nr:hypothetical protein [Desulfomicrobium escambiense]